jgi:Xaa-Pro aminopeptidase
MPFPDSAAFDGRHRHVRRLLEAKGASCLVVTNGSNIRYLSGHAGSAGTLLITENELHLLVDFRYQEAVRLRQSSDVACPGLVVWPVPASYDEALVDLLARRGTTGDVGFEAGHLTVARHEWLERTCAVRGLAIGWRRTERVVEQARLIKDPIETSSLRLAAAKLGQVAEEAFSFVRSGLTETELAGLIDSAIRRAGFDRPAFETIVASGPNSALPHHRPGPRRLAAGDLVVLDFGGVLDGYCSDLTRTVTVGAPGRDARRLHAAVSAAQRAALATVGPGATNTSVDAAARDVLRARGLGEAFGHGTGHGLGLDVHEEPRIGPPRPGESPVQLQPGMAFTVEPGAYVAGLGGVRIEDDVIVTAEGCEVLTSVPRELAGLG